MRGKKIVTNKPDGVAGDARRLCFGPGRLEQPVRGGAIFYDDAVAVSEVEEGTPAWQAGMRRGMLVSHVDGPPVRTPKEFQAAVARKSGPVQLRLATDDQDAVRTIPAEAAKATK